MLFVLRYLIARYVIHPLEGVTFADWRSILARERFRVSPTRWPKAAWITAWSLMNSAVAQRVERRFGAALAAAKVEAPVFILGHYRSGTTHLHELLSLDPRFASPTRFQTFNPHTFLSSERWLEPIVEPFMLPRRVQEDEVALMILSGLSPYLDWVFPRSARGYKRCLAFRDADPDEIARWSGATVGFLKALTVRYGKPLILKSPPHTARMKLLLEAFPDARFVHIRRNPYPVFSSTVGLLRAVRPVFGLQRDRGPIDVDAVLDGYAAMYDAYFDDRAIVPAGQLVEIAYEDLDRDPIGRLREVYDGLALGDFDEVRPAVEAYLASIAGYQKARHKPLDEALRLKIAAACARCFDEWGYPR
jgi:hypothetical protein